MDPCLWDYTYNYEEILGVIGSGACVYLKERHRRYADRNLAANLCFQIAILRRWRSSKMLLVVADTDDKQSAIGIRQASDIRALLVSVPGLLEIESELLLNATLRKPHYRGSQIRGCCMGQIVHKEIIDSHV
jgi:hypothetical protein